MNLAAEASTTSNAALIVAVVAVVMSGLSLFWQALSFFLTRGRVKVTIRAGLVIPDPTRTDRMFEYDPPESGPEWANRAEEDGYIPAVAVRVRNVGRLAVTVISWTLAVTREKKSGVTFFGDTSVGKPRPCRLDVGEAEVWYVHYRDSCLAEPLRGGAKKQTTGPISVRAEVELGDGRVRRGRGSFRWGHQLTTLAMRLRRATCQQKRGLTARTPP